MMKDNFSYTNKTRVKLPCAFKLLAQIKNSAMGEKYSVSLVFITPKLMSSLNFKHRGVRKATDVLSFKLENNNGEIFICPHLCQDKARDFGLSKKNYLYYIFIHALCHLKGMRHGSKMLSEEKKILQEAKLPISNDSKI